MSQFKPVNGKSHQGRLILMGEWEKKPALPAGPFPADIWLTREATSTFDLAWELAEQGRLAPWAGAVALSQTGGRGQLRRPWYSPEGNLHVSFLLPESPLFAGSSGSVLTALLIIRAFAAMGLELGLKWPNDLVLVRNGRPGKLAGLLLEERGGLIMAGLGVNRASAPPDRDMREGASLPAVTLPPGFASRSVLELWSELVGNIIMIYDAAFHGAAPARLLAQAEEILLWRGFRVELRGALEEDRPLRGRLLGLSGEGGLRLATDAGREEHITSGSIAGCL